MIYNTRLTHNMSLLASSTVFSIVIDTCAADFLPIISLLLSFGQEIPSSSSAFIPMTTSLRGATGILQDLRSVAIDVVSVSSSEEAGRRLTIEDGCVADGCGEGEGSEKIAFGLHDSVEEVMRSSSIDEVCANLSEEAALRTKLMNC